MLSDAPGRYVLISLLGKGGFSEVWKCFDVHLLIEVAVKVTAIRRLSTYLKGAMYTAIRRLSRYLKGAAVV
jgi:serine/threonine protein kinase